MASEDGCGPDAEGWITMKVRFDDEDQALFLVLAQGARVDVVEPLSLRARVAMELGAATERIRRLDAGVLQAHA